MMMFRLFMLAAGFVAFATVAVAADQKTSTSNGAHLNACDLLSADDVSTIVGAKVEAGSRNDAGATPDGAYSSTCVWKVPVKAGEPADPRAPLGARFAMLNTIAWPAGSGAAGEYLQSFRDAAKSNLIDMTPVPVHAGDDALWWGDGVAVRKGDISFGVSVHVGVDKPTERSMEESLAKKAVSKL